MFVGVAYLEMLVCGAACLATGAGILSWRRGGTRREMTAWDQAVADLNAGRDATQGWASDGRWRPLGWLLVILGIALLAIFVSEN